MVGSLRIGILTAIAGLLLSGTVALADTKPASLKDNECLGMRKDKDGKDVAVEQPKSPGFCKTLLFYQNNKEGACSGWKQCWGDEAVKQEQQTASPADDAWKDDEVCNLATVATDWMTKDAKGIGMAGNMVNLAIQGLDCAIKSEGNAAEPCIAATTAALTAAKVADAAKWQDWYALGNFGLADAEKQARTREQALCRLIEARDTTFEQIQRIATTSRASCQTCSEYSDWYLLRAAVWFVNYTRAEGYSDANLVGFKGKGTGFDAYAGLFAATGSDKAYDVTRLTPAGLHAVTGDFRSLIMGGTTSLAQDICTAARHVDKAGRKGFDEDTYKPKAEALYQRLTNLALLVASTTGAYVEAGAADASGTLGTLDATRKKKDAASLAAKKSVECTGTSFHISDALDNQRFDDATVRAFKEFGLGLCEDAGQSSAQAASGPAFCQVKK
ncbi:MAG: hypothetical protein R3D33_12850 [Hyphomicrobiaceae bacterium]